MVTFLVTSSVHTYQPLYNTERGRRTLPKGSSLFPAKHCHNCHLQLRSFPAHWRALEHVRGTGSQGRKKKGAIRDESSEEETQLTRRMFRARRTRYRSLTQTCHLQRTTSRWVQEVPVLETVVCGTPSEKCFLGHWGYRWRLWHQFRQVKRARDPSSI